MEFMRVSACGLTRPEAREQDRQMMDELKNASGTCNICVKRVNCCGKEMGSTAKKKKLIEGIN